MKRNRRTLIIALTFMLVGVAGQYAVRSVAQQNNMGMMGGKNCMMENRMPQGINPNQLPEPDSEGAQILGRYCSQCHGVPGPGMHTADEWSNVVARMNQRMQMMSQKRMMMPVKAPDNYELKILTAYLEKNAQQTIEANKLAGADTPEGQAFQKICTQCHALPDPAQHTVNEWPAVIERMRKNMYSMGKQLPDQSTIDKILRFLQTYAEK